MNRYFVIRDMIYDLVESKSHGYYKRNGYAHMFQVETICTMLAYERNLDPELCAIIGLLHDISIPVEFNDFAHAQKGAAYAKRMMVDTGMFSEEEIKIVETAIMNHSNKTLIQDSYSELIKDADVVSHKLDGHILKPHEKKRFEAISCLGFLRKA